MTNYESYQPTQRFAPFLAMSPNGSELLYSSNASGQYNLARLRLDGAASTQLTRYSDNAVRSAAWAPNGADIVYTADRDGDEFHQVYRLPAGSDAIALTDGPQVQFALAEDPFSADGRYLVYAGNDRVPTTQDVLVHDLASGEIRRLVLGDGFFAAVGFSPDGSQLLAMQMRSNSDSDLLLVDIDSGSSRIITGHDGEERNFPGPWAADGTGFWFRTDRDREFIGLAFYDLASNTVRTEETPDWDVDDVAYASVANRLVWLVNEDGISQLHGRNLADGSSIEFPHIPSGAASSLRISEDGRQLAFLLGTATRPTEAAVVDLGSGTFRYLTDSRPADLPVGVEPTLIRYSSHDNREIPAWLYRPDGPGPFPVVLSIHGGPDAQELTNYNYSGLYQYLVSSGIGVLATNVRGSTGYGKTYQKLIHRDWGGGELGDFDYAVRFLHTLDWVDPARIAVYGGSFGGFATLSCISRLPDLWAAAVSIVGPSNLVTFAKAVPPTWRSMMTSWVGDPYTEADFLLERSPITYADAIRTPLFVIQGAKDPRVVQAESDQIVASLRGRGVEVRYDVYPDEGHGFTRRKNELRAFNDVAEFLIERLTKS